MQIYFFVPMGDSTVPTSVAVLWWVLFILAFVGSLVLIVAPWEPDCPYCGSNNVIESSHTDIVWTSDGLIDKEATRKKEQFNKEHDQYRCFDCDKY